MSLFRDGEKVIDGQKGVRDGRKLSKKQGIDGQKAEG